MKKTVDGARIRQLHREHAEAAEAPDLGRRRTFLDHQDEVGPEGDDPLEVRSHIRARLRQVRDRDRPIAMDRDAGEGRPFGRETDRRRRRAAPSSATP